MIGRNCAAFVLLIAVALLGGCATKPEIPFDKGANNIKTIGILTPSEPDHGSVMLASSVGQSFGIVGALIDTGMRMSRESKFNTLLGQESFIFQDELLKSLSDKLTANGYAVSTVAVPRTSTGFLKAYPKGDETKVDAYLDVVVTGYGYIAAGIGSSTPYRPVDVMNVRLVRAADSKILMEDTVVFNPVGPALATNIVTVPPNPDYTFQDFDALTADPAAMTKGLKDSVDQSADAAAKLLR
jgi:hypothetical protein